MSPGSHDGRPTGSGETARMSCGDNIIVPTAATLGRSNDTASWLHIATWQLPELRAQRADYTLPLLDWMLRSRPGQTERGGGWQFLAPDGRWRSSSDGLWGALRFLGDPRRDPVRRRSRHERTLLNGPALCSVSLPVRPDMPVRGVAPARMRHAIPLTQAPTIPAV